MKKVKKLKGRYNVTLDNLIVKKSKVILKKRKEKMSNFINNKLIELTNEK